MTFFPEGKNGDNGEQTKFKEKSCEFPRISFTDAVHVEVNNIKIHKKIHTFGNHNTHTHA